MTTFLSAISIAELSEAHIVRLIADSVAESRDLDYKRSPYGDDREAKREFLKDVTALANTFNGHLIIGMAEVDGIASGLERHCCGQLGHHCGPARCQDLALLDFIYNLGTGAFRSSRLLRKLNAADYAGAAADFSSWVHAHGHTLHSLVKRRQDEIDLFKKDIQ